jgi:hypothetical protein
MSAGPIFISHASKDDDFVKELRTELEGHGVPVWVDSRNFRGGDKLAPEIAKAIEAAGSFLAVLSLHTVNSPWVRREIQKAIEIEKQHPGEYRVIPVMLPGIEPFALGLWFGEEPVGVKVELRTGGVSEAMPAVLAALGHRLATDWKPPKAVEAGPMAELLLKLVDPLVETVEGKREARRAGRPFGHLSTT